jgi:hypothetical protein
MLFIAFSILLLTGWKCQLVGDLQLRGFNLLLLLSLLLSPFTLDLYGIRVNGSLLPLLGWAVHRLLRFRPADGGPGIPALPLYILFLLCVWVWMRRLYALDPVFVLLHERWDAPLLIGALTALLIRRFRDQMSVLAVTLTAGQAIMAVTVRSLEETTLGGWGWWDGFSAAFISTHLTHNALLIFPRFRRQLSRHKSFRKGGTPER